MYRQPCTTIACVFGVLLVLGTLVPSTVLGQSPQATVLRVEGPGASFTAVTSPDSGAMAGCAGSSGATSTVSAPASTSRKRAGTKTAPKSHPMNANRLMPVMYPSMARCKALT